MRDREWITIANSRCRNTVQPNKISVDPHRNSRATRSPAQSSPFFQEVCRKFSAECAVPDECAVCSPADSVEKEENAVSSENLENKKKRLCLTCTFFMLSCQEIDSIRFVTTSGNFEQLSMCWTIMDHDVYISKRSSAGCSIQPSVQQFIEVPRNLLEVDRT